MYYSNFIESVNVCTYSYNNSGFFYFNTTVYINVCKIVLIVFMD